MLLTVEADKMKCFEVAIVEDTDYDADVLSKNLERFSLENDVKFNCVRFNLGEAFLADGRKSFDIVFMDMKLAGIDGLETSRVFRQSNPQTELFFITSIEQYAVKGYEVSANDFILKPVTYELFEAKLKKAIQRIFASEEAVSVRVSKKENVSVIPARNIYYIDVIKHDVTYHTADGDIVAYGSLNKLEADLSSVGFARCASWCIVNLRYIEGLYGDDIKLVSGQVLHISRSKKKSFMEQFARYCCGGDMR